MKDKEYIKELENELKNKDIELTKFKTREKTLVELITKKVTLKELLDYSLTVDNYGEYSYRENRYEGRAFFFGLLFYLGEVELSNSTELFFDYE